MAPTFSPYIGRFAPSPTGPLHAGSLVAALASWLDARAQQGRWLVRIEDIDQPRCKPEFASRILQQLAAHGLVSDGPVITQSLCLSRYETALSQLGESGLCYLCSCSRKDILQVLQEQGTPPARHQELIYPGTCRPAVALTHAMHLPGQALSRPPHLAKPLAQWAWRLNLSAMSPRLSTAGRVHWLDRRMGWQSQNLPEAVGDFVLKRADGYFAYQLAVVLDDAEQGITDVVRGEDLADNTARQIALQQALGLPTPRYLHTPLVRGANGEKLSKQNGAQALDDREALRNLEQAALCLGLNPSVRAEGADPVSQLLVHLVPQWAASWVTHGAPSA